MGVIITAMLCTMGSLVYSKSHKVRLCEICYMDENSVIVTHPNGLNYKYVHTDKEFAKEYNKGDMIKISFDELASWEKDYTINSIKY